MLNGMIDIQPRDPWLRFRLRWTWSKDGSAAVSHCSDVIAHDELIVISGDIKGELVMAVLNHGGRVFLKSRYQYNAATYAPVHVAAMTSL